MASTFSSSWSVTTVPTRRRTHVERLASSSAIRMYTSYSGMRSTGGADAPSGSRFRKWVLAATPSLETLMQLLIGIVVGVLPARPSLRQPRVEPGRHESVGTFLTLGGADREVVGVLVLGVVVVATHPPPLHGVSSGGLHQLLPQREVLYGAALAPPAARHPAGDPFVHPLDQVLGIGHVRDAGLAPLPVQPFQRRDGAGERHTIVGRVGRAFVQVPARYAVARGGVREDRLREPPEALLDADARLRARVQPGPPAFLEERLDLARRELRIRVEVLLVHQAERRDVPGDGPDRAGPCVEGGERLLPRLVGDREDPFRTMVVRLLEQVPQGRSTHDVPEDRVDRHEACALRVLD